MTDLAAGVGSTPVEDSAPLAAWAGVKTLTLKREDLNPTGSHKDRGALEQVRACLAEKQRVAVISSSGNAAIAAAHAARDSPLTIVALVSPLTAMSKVTRLREAGAHVVVARKAINHATRLSRVRGWPDLRPSTSEPACIGFRALGEELAAELASGLPVFGYASSGTTFAALAEVFLERAVRHPVHPVQAGLVNGFSREFGRPGDGERSAVGDLGVKVSPRTAEVLRYVRGSGGEAWWVGRDEIEQARSVLVAQGLEVAAECWAALAGVRAAARTGGVVEACMLLTGRGEGGDNTGAENAGEPVAETFDAVLSSVAGLKT